MSIKTKIKHLFHPIQGEIWCLHRVVWQKSIFSSNRELEITPDFLKDLITEKIQQGFSFVSIDDILSDINCKKWDLRKKKRINISFDDGFLDIYENAFPIFKKMNIPFTIYLVGDFPEKTSDLWWIQLEQYVNNDPQLFENRMKHFYNSNENMRDLMHKVTETSPDKDLSEKMTLSWNQLQEMVSSGLCTIGCHSMTHPALTRISHSQMAKELSESKQLIENNIQTTVKHFSYPHSMENKQIQTVLKNLGYQSACIGYGGSIRKGDNPFKLNRKYIIQK